MSEISLSVRHSTDRNIYVDADFDSPLKAVTDLLIRSSHPGPNADYDLLVQQYMSEVQYNLQGLVQQSKAETDYNSMKYFNESGSYTPYDWLEDQVKAKCSQWDSLLFCPVEDSSGMYKRFRVADASGFVMLGESREIFKLAIDIVRFFAAVISPTRWPRAFAQLKTFADLWLGWNFGLAPTLNDGKAILDGVNKLFGEGKRPDVPAASDLSFVHGLNELEDFPGSVSDDDDTVYLADQMGNTLLFGASNETIMRFARDGDINSLKIHYITPLFYQRRKIYVPASLFYDYLDLINGASDYDQKKADTLYQFFNIVGDEGDDDHQLAGQIIQMLWELIPFSWLVDYFFNVGSLIEETFAASAEPHCLRSARVHVTTFTGFEHGLIGLGDGIAAPIAHYGVRDFTHTETVLPTLPGEIETPPITGDLEMGQWLNILAAGVSIFHKN